VHREHTDPLPKVDEDLYEHVTRFNRILNQEGLEFRWVMVKHITYMFLEDGYMALYHRGTKNVYVATSLGLPEEFWEDPDTDLWETGNLYDNLYFLVLSHELIHSQMLGHAELDTTSLMAPYMADSLYEIIKSNRRSDSLVRVTLREWLPKK
jgi:hypothetical protein